MNDSFDKIFLYLYPQKHASDIIVGLHKAAL